MAGLHQAQDRQSAQLIENQPVELPAKNVQASALCEFSRSMATYRLNAADDCLLF